MIDNKTIRKVIMLNKCLKGGSPTYENREATGAIANFTTNVVMPFISLDCEILPIQEGTGTPSPSNPRPISGTSTLDIYHSGADTSDYDTTSVSLGQEIMGGTANVVGGTGEETWGVIDLSNVQWSITTNRAIITELRGIIKPPLNNNVPSEAIAEKYSAIAWAESLNDHQTSYGVASDGTVVFYYDGTTPTGLFVYPLATPTDFTFTGQPIRSLLGVNNVWTDSGNTKVTYKYKTGEGGSSTKKYLPIFYDFYGKEKYKCLLE